MKIGVVYPQTELGGDPAAVRRIGKAVEDLGFDYLLAYDHVLGAEHADRTPPLPGPYTELDPFHDPFVMFGFLAGVTKLGFSTGVLILAQRQAVLVAKQAASLDVLCDGRFRLGVGVGWNELEFVGLNENFRNRGRRSEEQVQVMQKLWADPHVEFIGKWHRIEDAGINPRPPSGRVPVWFGGHHELTLQRIAQYGDGWMMLAYPMGQQAVAEFDRLRRMVEAAGRDPHGIGLEVWVSTGAGDPQQWREEFRFWQRAGVTHVTVASTHGRGVHARIAGRTMQDHIAAITQYREAVADLL